MGEKAVTGKPTNMDPPPPYTANDFDRVPSASSAPQYAAGPQPPPMGFVAPGIIPIHGPNPQTGPVPTVHAVNVVHVANPQVGPRPTTLVCPSCRQTVTTRLMYEAGSKTHLVCLLLCLLQCYLCCLLPYCVDSCQNGVHSCPKCGAYIGTYSD